MSNKAGMGTYLVSAIASAWSGMTVMNLSTDNQARHLAAILFAIAVVLVIIGVAVNVKRSIDSVYETKSDESKPHTFVQPSIIRSSPLPMSTEMQFLGHLPVSWALRAPESLLLSLHRPHLRLLLRQLWITA